MHYKNLPAVVYRSPLMHAHPASAETTPQTEQTCAVAPAWPWQPSNPSESLEADPVVQVADKNPSAVSLPLVSPGYENDQSGEAMAKESALSPRSALPPVSTLSAAMAPPEADPH